ncbi:MAG: mechanosensitive ion channel family protein [Acidobacteria bacterium]|nr:mechanosensitive ion channel family protein [Acidobacteriota bacterium]
MTSFLLFNLFQEPPNATGWLDTLTNGVVLATLLDIVLKLTGAVLALLAGRWVIGYAVRAVDSTLRTQKVDPTLIRYSVSSLTVLLNIALVVAILGFFGFETTTFAALLAGAGLAVGAAWGGLLANFAAGVFLVILHPFKVGDKISAGGVTGRVTEIGMFVTTVRTDENVVNYVGNNKIFSDNIENFSESRYRKAESRIQLGYDVDLTETIELLKARLPEVPNVLEDPAPEIEVVRISRFGPVLQVAPACHPSNFSQVLSDTNLKVIETLRVAGVTSPVQNIAVQVQQESNGHEQTVN